MFPSIKVTPSDFNQAYIAGAASAGLAVNMNTFLFPYFSTALFSLPNNGPRFPPITLLNSEKSNVAPISSKLVCSKANSVASIFLKVPSGIVTPILLFVIPTVSSKSNTDIPITGGFILLDISKAVS